MPRSAWSPDLRQSGGLWRRAARLGSPDLDLNFVRGQLRRHALAWRRKPCRHRIGPGRPGFSQGRGSHLGDCAGNQRDREGRARRTAPIPDNALDAASQGRLPSAGDNDRPPGRENLQLPTRNTFVGRLPAEGRRTAAQGRPNRPPEACYTTPASCQALTSSAA